MDGDRIGPVSTGCTRLTQGGRALGVVVAALVVLGLLVVPARAGAQGVSGIDVSNWQRQIDWLTVSGTGNSFVFAKATEGTTFTDLTFALNRSGATLTGLRFGAYHFARPSGSTDATVVASAVAQAEYFLSVAEPLPRGLLPALDVETTGGLPVPLLTLWVQTWLQHVVVRTGVKPIVYVSPSFWKTRLGDSPVAALAGHRLWIAHWTKDALPILPGAGWGGLGWSFWQWSNCQKVAGIVGCVDANRFNGTNLGTITVPAYPSGPPVRADAPTILGSPQAGKLLAARPGAWAGGKPVSFTYQWQRCQPGGNACAAIANAKLNTYTPTAADIGRPLKVRVSASTPAATASAVSAPTLAIASAGTTAPTAPKPRTPPTIAGTPQVGQTLSGAVGTWTGSPTSFAYQWRRCLADGTPCLAIDGAGRSTYLVSPGDIGATLLLAVTATGKGGAGTNTSAPTQIIAAAPIPTPAVGTTVSIPGQAGAVTTVSGVATATWQPGSLANQTTVALNNTTSRLSLQGTAVQLSFGSSTPLPWPIDLAYPAAPADAVPGILPIKGVWQPLAQLPTPTLPANQQAGTYRDSTGALHVLTRTPARFALFAPGKWGDPRYTTNARPHLAIVTHPITRNPGNRRIVTTRITLDTQAHIYVSLTTKNNVKVLLPQAGARIGWWLQGKPTKTLQALQLRPGAIPLRLPLRADQPRRAYTLRITAIDPYGRKTTLTTNVK